MKMDNLVEAAKDGWKRFVAGKDGDPVLWQPPNLPQLVGWAALLLSWPLGGAYGYVAGLISFGGFFTWAWLEIFEGDSYFRRTLGGVVMVIILVCATKF
jgi:hypothetical protein